MNTGIEFNGIRAYFAPLPYDSAQKLNRIINEHNAIKKSKYVGRLLDLPVRGNNV